MMKPRVLYFAVFVYFSLAGGRFTSTFLEHELQFTENWMISCALATQQLISMICSPWLGMIADSLAASKRGETRGRLLVMSLGLLVSTIATLLHSLDSLWIRNTSNEVQQTDSEINNDDNDIDVIGAEVDSSRPIIPSTILIYHLLLRALFSMGTCGCMPVCDGLTLAQIEREGRDKQEYGKERTYGAISWGIAHILLGPAIDLFGFRILYATIILAYIGCMITFHLYARSNPTTEYSGVIDDSPEMSEKEEGKIPDQAMNPPQKGSRKHESKRGLEDNGCFENDTKDTISASSQERLTFVNLVRLIFREKPILTASIIISFFALFIGISVVENLIFLYFEFLGGSNTMCGLTVLVTVLFEIPLFHFAPDVLKLLGSPIKMLEWGCFAYVVRVIGYSVIPQSHPYWVLVLEPLHGITYACAIASGVAVADGWVPRGYESSGQGFLSMVRSLGNFVGLCIGAFVEGRTLYRVLAGLVTVGTCILGAGNNLTIKHHIRKEGDNELSLQLSKKQGLELDEMT